jgi:hypothetical protein
MEKLDISLPEPTVNLTEIRRKYHRTVAKEKRTK